MLRHSKIAVGIAFLVLLIISVGIGRGQNISQEPISPIYLEVGESDTLLVNDLFFAPEYELKFGVHTDIDLTYLRKQNRLVLKPRPGFEGFTTIKFEFEGSELELPVFSRIRQKHTFSFRVPSRPLHRMNLMGTFNDWNRSNLPMHDRDGDGWYELELALAPGQYLYQFVYDEQETPDPGNPTRVDNGFGGYNSVLQIPPRHIEKMYLHMLRFERQNGMTVLKFYFEHSKGAEQIAAENVVALLGNQRLNETSLRLHDNGEIDLTLTDDVTGSRSVVRVIATVGGQTTNLQTVRLDHGLPAGAVSGSWSWHDASIYSLMIDRFYDGDPTNNDPIVHDSLDARVNYRGGDLQGVIDKLETGYFDSLGINTLWLSPVNENTNRAEKEWPAPRRFYSGYHGYWPVNDRMVEEHFGDLKLLKKLISSAHSHGIRVLLDFIANHVHDEHPNFREHRSWFGKLGLPDGRRNIRLFDEYRLTTWFDTFLPSYDFETSIEAVESVSDNAVWWLNETGADGFRHDAVKHIPNKFWRTLTKKIKTQVEPHREKDVYQIGETFGSYQLVASYVNDGQLDAQFNFNLYDVAMYVFLNPESDFRILASELEKTAAVFGVNHLMGNVMDSHDKTRFMAYADGDIPQKSSDSKEIGWTSPPQVDHPSSYRKVKLYLTYLFTIPGLPVLFYGDEFGMTGAADPDNRRMMRFGDSLHVLEKAMLKDVSRLVKTRNRHSALRHGDIQTLYANQHCFAYMRSDMNERVLVVLNKDDDAHTIRVAVPQCYKIRRAENLLSEEVRAIDEGEMKILLPGQSGSIWRLAASR